MFFAAGPNKSDTQGEKAEEPDKEKVDEKNAEQSTKNEKEQDTAKEKPAKKEEEKSKIAKEKGPQKKGGKEPAVYEQLTEDDVHEIEDRLSPDIRDVLLDLEEPPTWHELKAFLNERGINESDEDYRAIKEKLLEKTNNSLKNLPTEILESLQKQSKSLNDLGNIEINTVEDIEHQIATLGSGWLKEGTAILGLQGDEGKKEEYAFHITDIDRSAKTISLSNENGKAEKMSFRDFVVEAKTQDIKLSPISSISDLTQGFNNAIEFAAGTVLEDKDKNNYQVDSINAQQGTITVGGTSYTLASFAAIGKRKKIKQVKKHGKDTKYKKKKLTSTIKFVSWNDLKPVFKKMWDHFGDKKKLKADYRNALAMMDAAEKLMLVNPKEGKALYGKFKKLKDELDDKQITDLKGSFKGKSNEDLIKEIKSLRKKRRILAWEKKAYVSQIAENGMLATKEGGFGYIYELLGGKKADLREIEKQSPDTFDEGMEVVRLLKEDAMKELYGKGFAKEIEDFLKYDAGRVKAEEGVGKDFANISGSEKKDKVKKYAEDLNFHKFIHGMQKLLEGGLEPQEAFGLFSQAADIISKDNWHTVTPKMRGQLVGLASQYFPPLSTVFADKTTLLAFLACKKEAGDKKAAQVFCLNKDFTILLNRDKEQWSTIYRSYMKPIKDQDTHYRKDENAKNFKAFSMLICDEQFANVMQASREDHAKLDNYIKDFEDNMKELLKESKKSPKHLNLFCEISLNADVAIHNYFTKGGSKQVYDQFRNSYGDKLNAVGVYLPTQSQELVVRKLADDRSSILPALIQSFKTNQDTDKVVHLKKQKNREVKAMLKMKEEIDRELLRRTQLAEQKSMVETAKMQQSLIQAKVNSALNSTLARAPIMTGKNIEGSNETKKSA